MISVIIPVYNAEKYLEECIISVLEQSYEDIEVILVNDGSTDRSQEICEKYKKIDKRVILINKDNGGAATARNTGLDNVRGEFIAFIDADDVINKSYFEILMNQLIENNADLAMCTFTYFKDKPTWEETGNYFVKIMTGRECVLENYGELCVETVSPCLKLFKTKDFDDIRFPEGRVAEDEYVFYQVLYALNKCVFIPQKLYAYRKHEGSVTTGNQLRIVSDKVDGFRQKADFFHEKADEELYVKSLRVCEICLAQKILMMDKKCQKDYLQEMNRYKKYYWNEIVKLPFAITDKIKFLLFIINKQLYKKAKNFADKKDAKKHLEKHTIS